MTVFRFFAAVFLCFLFMDSLLNATILDFPTAYKNILENTYELKAADIEIIAKEADRWQAGSFPNPVLLVNVSSFGRDQNGTENFLFVGVTQIIELGGKRSARLRVAGASQCSSRWTFEIVKNELLAKLLHAFIDTAIAQERLALATGQHQVAEQTLKAISQASKTSKVEERKAQIAFHISLLAYKKQLSNLQKVKQQLSSLWDTNPPSFDAVSFPLFQITPPPALESLMESLQGNPEIIKAEAQAAFASELVSLEQSKRIPDIAVQVGVSAEKFTHEPALTLGVGIPLPIFDRNQGNISRASYEQLEASYKQLDIKKDLQADLKIAYHDWVTAYEQASVIKESLLPAANEAFHLAQESYLEGKTDYLNFLEASAALFDSQQQYLNVIDEYHHKRADVLKLTASNGRLF